jgi:protein-disulfide isomerase
MLKRHIFFILGLFIVFSSLAHAQSLGVALFRSASPVAGNPHGKITIAEFFDYQCSHCIAMAPVLAAIIKANPDVQVVFKEFPILGDMSTLAARAALAVNKQNKALYYPFHHALMTTDRPLTQNIILNIANSMGINISQLETNINSSSVTQQLNNNQALARRLGLNGTPAFFFAKTQDPSDYHFVLGDMSQSDMQAAIDKAKK